MLCEVCHEREATIHDTNIAGDAITTQNLCNECFEFRDASRAQELSSVSQAGCSYCGGEPQCTCPDLSAASGDAQKLCVLCGPCAQEFYRFIGLKLPGFATGKITPEQVPQVPTVLAELDRHMKQWVSGRL